MEIIKRKISFGKYQTFVRTVGRRNDKAPLVLLHGGPWFNA